MAESGVPLAELIERLSPKKRGKGRLKPAPGRSAIGESVATAYPSASAAGAISSPLTEVADTRTYYATAQFLTSSDGFFVLEYYPVETVSFLDAGQNEVQVVFDDASD
jgi:hypothetical protein